MSKVHHINALPLEMVMHIATFLDVPELLNCNYVSESFNMISKDYSLWKKFFVDIKTEDAPVGRLCHTAVVHDERMFVFGGHITQPSSEYFHTVKQDMHAYDFATRKWSMISEGGARRAEHTTVVEGNRMYVFGGYSGTGYESSVSVFDFTANQWYTMEAKGDIPSARSAHTAVVVGKCMYVFGGWNGTHCMNDLYELNLETHTWTRIQYTGEPPCTRCSHGATVYTNANGVATMSVFGGYAIEKANDPLYKGYLNDLYEFNFATKAWKRVITTGTAPSPRSRFRMVSHKDSIYLFAGWNSTAHFSNLFKFSHTTRMWEEIQTNFEQDGIGQFSLVVHNDVMYVFSGFSPKVGSRNNLFAYPLVPQNQQAY
jgi:N-acetylneuraminic acid mutarotase